MDYSNFSDEEIVTLYRDGDEECVTFLLQKYKPLVSRKAGIMFLLGADHDDLIQEGMIGLLKAIRDYDMGRDASFGTFAELCVMRQLYSSVKAYQRKKHSMLNDARSLQEEGDTNGGTLLSRLVGEGQDPEKIVIDKENVERIQQIIDDQLSSFEKSVLELHLTGMVYTEIARVLNKDSKSTDNALQRAKGKIRKALNSEGV